MHDNISPGTVRNVPSFGAQQSKGRFEKGPAVCSFQETET